MALSDKCKGRLVNWKFGQARQYAEEDATEAETELIDALNGMLGNSGWFGGDLGVIVGAAVENLVRDWDEEDADDGEAEPGV